MREIVKNFNFCNFKVEVKEECIEKNSLSINEFVNTQVYGKIFKTSNGFENFLKQNLSTQNFELLKNNYNDKIYSFIYITNYNYDNITNNNYNNITDESYDKINNKSYDNIYFLLDKDFCLYKLIIEENNAEIVNLEIKFNNMPTIFFNNGKLYFYSTNDKFIYFDSSDFMISISNFTDISTFCYYQDKLFFTTKNNPFLIYYTEKLDIENISDDLSSYNTINIDISDGKILKIIKFKNNIFVIQQYAISRIIEVDENYYFYSNCFVKSRIFDNSICEFNDYLLFYSTSGLYIFDGNEFKQIFDNITNKFLDNSIFKAVVFNNKYYILASMIISGAKKNIIVEFDIFNNSSVIYHIGSAVDIYVLKSMNRYNFIAINEDNNNFEILSLNTNELSLNNKYIKFNKICFDDNFTKTLMGIKILGSGRFLIKISSENSFRIINVNNNLNISSLGIKGYAFEIEIFSEDAFEIKSILLSVQTVLE